MRRAVSLRGLSVEVSFRGKYLVTYPVIPWDITLQIPFSSWVMECRRMFWIEVRDREDYIKWGYWKSQCRGDIFQWSSSHSGDQKKSKDDFIRNAQACAKCWIGWQTSKPSLPPWVIVNHMWSNKDQMALKQMSPFLGMWMCMYLHSHIWIYMYMNIHMFTYTDGCGMIHMEEPSF